ncbi:MAG: transcription antitermination factor NusB, partial [Eggerthellaceae bacterium]|nr:transcription antitermination factor NusB [Eggerthellaceae bacterium]
MGRPRKPKNTFSSKVTPARKLAYDVLTEIRIHKVFLEQAWNKQVRNRNLPPAEIAFARLLATQVVSHKGSLDELINFILKSPDDIQSGVREALRISFSELFYLGKQDHVVVNEGVELVRSVAPKASGVANFVLRRACELKPSFPFGDPDTEVKAASLAFGYPSWLVLSLRDTYGIEAADRFLKNSNEPAPFFFVINQAHAN